jgi:hypothetical protein
MPSNPTEQAQESHAPTAQQIAEAQNPTADFLRTKSETTGGSFPAISVVGWHVLGVIGNRFVKGWKPDEVEAIKRGEIAPFIFDAMQWREACIADADTLLKWAQNPNELRTQTLRSAASGAVNIQAQGELFSAVCEAWAAIRGGQIEVKNPTDKTRTKKKAHSLAT